MAGQDLIRIPQVLGTQGDGASEPSAPSQADEDPKSGEAFAAIEANERQS
jgi:hypothetical protein